MLEWLVSNKSWLFDGVGGSTALLAISGLVRWIWRRRRKSEGTVRYGTRYETVDVGFVGPVVPTGGARISSITAKEVLNAVDDAPPLQRKSIENSYKGITVEWKAPFFHADEEDDDLVRVMLSVAPGKFITFSVFLKIYPELKVVREGRSITVMGRIQRCSSGRVYLDSAQLTIHPK